MSRRICLIGKYFPIQGGVSKDNQWLAYTLAKAGFQVHIVTNAEEVEAQYRCLNWSSFPALPPDCPGSISVHTTEKANRRHYIPYANPFVTKLAAIATEVIRAHQCDMIYSYYLEPYAIAAFLASRWTGVPYGLRHAGSDVGTLFQSPELQPAYREVMHAADYIIASPSTYLSFLHLGINQDKLYFPAGAYLPTQFFNPEASPLDVNALLAWMHHEVPDDPYYQVYHRFAQKTFQADIPTIGIYGKVGIVKGSFDLVKALGHLQREGLRFQFIALTQGSPSHLTAFAHAIEEEGLQNETWLLPFVPHWTIPQFIRACTAICYLERDFPIPIHSPLIPQEVLACGTCLVLSHEIANKQSYREHLHHGTNVFCVDPHQHHELAAVLRTIIQNPQASQRIGHQGFSDMRQKRERYVASDDGWCQLFPRIYEEIQHRRQMMSLAEMQSYLARLYTDDGLRTLLALQPESSFESYLLTEHEKQALRAIDHTLLEYFATSLKMKQQERFRTVYPTTFTLPKALISRFFQRFYQLYPVHHQENSFQRMLDFGLFLEQSLACDEHAPSYASEVVKYERLHYTYTYQTMPEDTFTLLNTQRENDVVPLHLTSVPMLLPGVYRETFTYPITDLIDALHNQQSLETIVRRYGHYEFVFQREPRSLILHVFELNAATSFLLDLCQKNITIQEIIVLAEQHLEETGLTEDIMSILTLFQEKQFITGGGKDA